MNEKKLFLIFVCLFLIYAEAMPPFRAEFSRKAFDRKAEIGDRVEEARDSSDEILCEYINSILEQKKVKKLPFSLPPSTFHYL
jgi:hypothetical protein